MNENRGSGGSTRNGLAAPHPFAIGLGCALLWLVFCVQSCRAHAEPPCAIPPGLALHDIVLPAAKREIGANRHLTVLTFGGVQVNGDDDEARRSTYPARLSAELSAALPRASITVVNEAPPGQTSADVALVLPDLIAKSGARLVIWAPGGRDVAARVQLDAFTTAVKAGIEAVRQAGADLILLDTTFVPSPGRMAMIEAYRQSLLALATSRHVPLLRRHDLMRHWSEDGTLNLSARDAPERGFVARRLFACVARGLAMPIAEALR